MINTNGTLSVYYQSVPGAVCSGGFDWFSAYVSCKVVSRSSFVDLYDMYQTYQPCFQQPFASANCFLNNFTCLGNESSLDLCNNSGWKRTQLGNNNNCISLSCRPVGEAQIGRFEGYVAGIKHLEEEGFLCDHNFSQNTGDVFCQTLKQDSSNTAIRIDSGFPCPGFGARSFHLSNVDCSGLGSSNATFGQCSNNGWGNAEGCGANSCVRIVCKDGKQGEE